MMKLPWKKVVPKQSEAERMGYILVDFGRHIRSTFEFMDKAISANESSYKDFDIHLTQFMLTAYSHLDRAIVELDDIDMQLDESTRYFLRYTTKRCRFFFVDFFNSDETSFYSTYLLVLEHLVRTGYVDDFYYQPMYATHYYTGLDDVRKWHDYSLKYEPIVKDSVADGYVDENGNLIGWDD